MLEQEMARRDFGSVEDGFAGDVRELLLVALASRAALARAQEDAAVDAQDILSQADEALVMG